MVQLLGMDVSEHNGRIDWDKVKADGKIKFVMIRCGYGKSQVDQRFEENVRGVERVGIPWGVYHYSYALTVGDAKKEAELVLKLLKGKRPTFPVAFDMEDADEYKKKNGFPSAATLVAICETFLSAIEAAGYKPMLYASLSWLNGYLNDTKLNKYPKWVAEWGSKCTYSKPYEMWQFTNSGKTQGVKGNVDLNYCFNYMEKGEKYMDYLILYNGDGDRAIALDWADKLRCPVIRASCATPELLKAANKVYQVGGTKAPDGVELLSGGENSDRFDTYAAVLRKLGKIK